MGEETVIDIRDDSDIVAKCPECGLTRALSASGWAQLVLVHERQPLACVKCNRRMIAAARGVWAETKLCGKALRDHQLEFQPGDGCKVSDGLHGRLFTDCELRRDGQDWG